MNINLTATIIEKGQTIGVSVSNLISGAAWSTSYFSCPNHFITSNHNGSETITGVNGGGTNLSGTVTFYAYKADGVTFLGSCSASFTVTPIKAKGISVTPTSRIFTYMNEEQYLVKTVSPAETYDQSVTWSSSDPAVATVNSGTVRAIGNGSCTITVTTADGTNLSASCSVTVSIPIKVTSITISPTSLNFSANGQQGTISVTSILPANASNKTVSWTTSDPSVASVSNGVVTVTKSSYGSASCTITCAATDGSGVSASCSVSVNIPDPTIHVTGVSLNKSSTSLIVGGTDQLSATVSPSNATNKNVSWSTSNSSVATVSGGTITAVGAGNCSITVTTSDGGFTASCSVSVSVANPRPSNFSYTYAKVSGGAVYSTTISGGVIIAYIMPATEWNALTTRINDFRRYKLLSNYGFTTVSSGTNFTPAIYNEAITAINAMGFSLSSASSGNISAAMLNSLVTTINSIS